jgi:uncharacterized cupredoxin-like copper-binding protein
MRRFILTAIIFTALVAVGNQLAQKSFALALEKETAVVDLTDKTQVLDKVLPQGKYLFEHDDARMSRGEACMFIYTYKDGKAGELAASFHCIPVDRKPVKLLVVSVAMTKTPDVFRLTEIQFAGESKGHLVPEK